ncbi:MAG TPA: Gfo/Idh/MocA family oxidoreductase [Vicinamibacterales bacterium]|nr:Gfo/Idh/MocA family oxidoreductase [Vicinamibacterales bacterium]
MTPALHWGVIGTGGIAADFCQALNHSTQCVVVNVAGSSPAKARDFAGRFAIPRWSDGLATLLDDPRVEAIYVATPHHLHEEHAMAAIAAGRHVLCEKPLTLEERSAGRVIAAARRRGVFLMEAFMYRCHPLLRELLVRLEDGVIGPVRHVRADFGFRAPRSPGHRLFSPALGGGSILDVGGYPVSFARLIAGVVERAPFAEPVALTASGLLGPTGVDELATAHLTFASGFTASVTSAVSYDVGMSAIVFGDRGRVVLPNPWIPNGGRQSLEAEFTVHVEGREPETVTIRTDMPTYGIEAEYVARTLPAIEPKWPAMSWADTLGNLRVMDGWRASLRAQAQL